MTKKIEKVCQKGHKFYKSSDCPTCPICEKEREPKEGFLSLLSAPARRALENNKITTLKQLAKYSEKDVLQFHGIGKTVIPILKKALTSEALSFKSNAEESSTKNSDPDAVNAFMKKLKHPHLKVAEELRKIILNTDKTIGEEINWNAPTFFYTGKMKPFAPKEHKRVIIVFNLFKKDCIRLVFLTGAKTKDTSGLLEGDYADGRRLGSFYSLEDLKAKEKDLVKIIKTWLKLLEK